MNKKQKALFAKELVSALVCQEVDNPSELTMNILIEFGYNESNIADVLEATAEWLDSFDLSRKLPDRKMVKA